MRRPGSGAGQRDQLPEVYNDPQLLRQKSDELEDLRFHQEELFAAWEAAVEEQEQYERSLSESTGEAGA